LRLTGKSGTDRAAAASCQTGGRCDSGPGLCGAAGGCCGSGSRSAATRDRVTDTDDPGLAAAGGSFDAGHHSPVTIRARRWRAQEHSSAFESGRCMGLPVSRPGYIQLSTNTPKR
jgi:hypothetical protein